jgi:hypothetical protein
LRNIHGERVGVDVDQNGLGADVLHCGNRGNESERYRNDFITGTDAGREQGELQGAGSGVDADSMLHAAKRGEVFLEGFDLGPEDEAARFENTPESFVDLGFQAGDLGLEVDQGDGG